MKRRRVISCNRLKRCQRVAELLKENSSLKETVIEQAAQIDDLRKNLYGRRKKKPPELTREPKKKGAPFGHKGVTREKPGHIDEEIELVPSTCTHCGSADLEKTTLPPDEHIQEDIVLPKKKATKYKRPVFKCRGCGKLVRGELGREEIPNAYIGPVAKSFAGYLRYGMGIPMHKIKGIFKELFDLEFDQTAVAGFEKQLRVRSQALYEQMRDRLKLAKLLYLDETGWPEGTINLWLWCCCNKQLVFYHINESRGSDVITSILGKKFSGMFISDFLSAYNRIEGLKQKCLAHVLRMIERYYMPDAQVQEFCDCLKELMRHIIFLFKERRKTKDYPIQRADTIVRIKRLLSQRIKHERTDKWRRKLQIHQDELYACLFHPDSDFNNNFVERMLRLSVIMRKITFGSRSENGIKNHAVIMSVFQTARLHNQHPAEIFHRIFTKPHEVSLSSLIRAP
jgi:hypothetical protein